jgi:pimeloyl-ACP methyl ester carboxylesterase/DNA-binding CsgD family transcriptional regulator
MGTTPASPPQELRFCRSADGAQIAYAIHGQGPALVVDACWLSHLQYDWQSPVWRHYLHDFGAYSTVIRFDERGHGLSDRNVTDHGLEARLADLEAVVDAAGLDRFVLLAMSQGGPVAITYAARHPERIAGLIFSGSYSFAAREDTPDDIAMDDAFERLIQVGWARPESEFRRVFSSMMIPGGTEEQRSWLDELQRVAVDTETALLSRRQRKLADADRLLGELTAPTLVVHSLGDRMNNFAEARHLAANIAGARLVALESDNHIVLEDEPAWPVLAEEVRRFVLGNSAGANSDRDNSDRVAGEPADGNGARSPGTDDGIGTLSVREVEVLRLASRGLDNDGIAAALTLSPRTVERHLQNAYAKLGVSGRSARTAAVARLLALP